MRNTKRLLTAAAVACVSLATAGKAMAAVVLPVDGVSQKNPTNQPTVSGIVINVVDTSGNPIASHNGYTVHPFGPAYNYASGRAGMNVPQANSVTTVTGTFTFNASYPGNNSFSFNYYMLGLANENVPIIFPASPAANGNRNVSMVTQDAVTGKYYGLTGGSFDTTTQFVGSAASPPKHHVCKFSPSKITGPQSPIPTKANGVKRTAFQFYTDPASTLNPNGANSWSDIVIFNPIIGVNANNQHDNAGGIFQVNLTPIDSLFNFNSGGQ